jgi:hypothetical protein
MNGYHPSDIVECLKHLPTATATKNHRPVIVLTGRLII